jgi:membrane fusion protein, copper/silver efflux system
LKKKALFWKTRLLRRKSEKMEKKKKSSYTRILLLFVVLVAVFAVGYLFGGWGGHLPHQEQPVHDEHAAAQEQAGDIIWTCSMHPQIRLPEPGKCPICFMDLIPVKIDASTDGVEAVSLRQIRLSPEARKLAEVEVFPVERRDVHVETPMFGKMDYDETRLGYITTWMAGRIDKLYVDYTGSSVRKGDPMASIYSPELVTAQAELIQAVRAAQEVDKSGFKRVRDAAEQTVLATREKLRLLGLTADQIQKVVESGAPSDHIMLHSPLSGVVIKKDVLEGMYVQTGTRIYTIADLSRLWVVLEAYESDLPWVRLGMEVEFQAEAYRGEVFRGKIVFVDPVVEEKTRTVRVRLEVANPAGKLKPGMFVRALKQTRPVTGKQPLVIPASAPLITGKRAVVYVQAPGKEGTYEGKEIVLGPKAGEYYIVRHGLSEGDLVVTRGNFKIDSAVQLLAKPSMMSPSGGPAVAAHDHGPRTTTGESLPSPSIIPVPPALASQLPKLAHTYDTLKTTIGQKDLQRTRQAYQVFYDVLCAIDPTSLKDQSALMWKEATMLLRNDGMLGAEADTNEEAARLFRTLSDHYQILKDNFHVDHILQAEAVSESVPLEFKKEMGELLRLYLDLQESLANDDFATAKKAAENFASALKRMDMGLLKGEAHGVWMETLDMLNKGVNAITLAKDIETARTGFEPLSIGMTMAVDRLGVEIKGPIFEIFCPMAFDNRGAAWLQQDKDTRNPYFGAMMLKCGEVKRQLKGE